MNKFKRYLGRVIYGSSFDEYVQAFISGDDLPSLGNGINVDTDTAMSYSAVFGCIRVLSETLASMPIMIYRKKPNGDRELGNDILLYDLLHNVPNPDMSPFSFKEACMMSLNTGGNSFCSRATNKLGETIALYPLEWQKVSIDRDDANRLIYVIGNGPDKKTLTRNEIFHITGMSFNGINGVSPIEYATSAIALGLSYEKFCNNFYKNGAHASGVFTFPHALSEDAYHRLKKDLGKAYTGLSNTGKPILLEEGGSFNQLTIKPADAQLIESKKFQIEDICRIYRVPLHLVQNLDRATFNNIEHLSLSFATYSMMPWFKRFEEAFNSQLLSQSQRRAGYYAEFKVDALLRGDIKSRYEAYAQARLNGFMSINDIRRLENMNSIDNGDTYLQPLSYADVNIINSIQLKNVVNAKVKAMAEEIQTMIESHE